MLTDKQIEEIKEHLEKAQNPIFYYDNDADGLCSFLLLRRYLGRGTGVAVRSYPDLNKEYAKKATELKADYVFALDKPVLSRDFVEEIDKLGLPLVWIDHHVMKEEFEHDMFVYNRAKNKGKEQSSEPVTYWAYKITGKDMWIAIMGCIADHFMPDFSDEFGKEYPEFWGEVKSPFDAYYNTEIGKIAQALGFGLKDSITNIVALQNFLIKCNSPSKVLTEEPGNSSFRRRVSDIMKKFDNILERAKNSLSGNLIFFVYSGELSISAEISNKLCFLYPDKYVAVAYKKEGNTNISLRGKDVREILDKILSELSNATGGGHKDAVGARIRTEDLDKFKKRLEEEVNKK